MDWVDSFVPNECQWMPFYFENDIENIDDKKAPFVPLTHDVCVQFVDFMNLSKDDILLDMGCGDGRILIQSLLASECKEGYGIDIEPEAIQRAETNKVRSQCQKPLHLVCGDFFTTKEIPWDKITVVSLYLLPEVLDLLYPLLEEKLHHTTLYTAVFPFGENTKFGVHEHTPFPDFYKYKF
ncbi:hypothetical protein EIN_086630 [Entamoeba invadens IP1]|uniref:hypothetical protein n=1 Tax=Entamoeba invadens IP1 TaxID=370355 RepID=UPI0002C3E4F0|nr:hypothetical protein EIN_086630 [Entamoeba invadens IP1]ELP85381.1 hypothetical protein EIN_086630 [Entamoeba invadens IP1]|eukprot:XP_004184727.1 hypothetical protein EIN_086630 [Entamoeba invadens IP1]